VQSAFAVSVSPGTISAVEGAQFNGQVATFSDLGLLGCQSVGSYTSSVTWGDDNSTSTALVGAPTQSGLGCTYPVSAAHRFVAIGAQHFTVTVSGTLGSDHGTGTANVSAAPLSSQPALIHAVESQSVSATVATFVDGFSGRPASHYTATIDWGDNSSAVSATVVATGNGSFAVQGSHTYASVGSAPVTVRISDPEGSHTTAASSAVITDAPLSSTGVASAATEGQDFTATVARFTDADPGRGANHYAASVDWGDGSDATAAAVVADSAGGFDVIAGHHYADAGSYTTTVTVGDPDGSTTTAVSQAAVADAPLSSAGIATNAVAGQPFTANLAVFTDADGGRPAGHYTATVDWGDGSSTSAPAITSAAAGAYGVSAGHTYATAGSFPTTVTITDPGGSRTVASSTASVAAPPPPPPPPPPAQPLAATGPAATPALPSPTVTTTTKPTVAATILPTPKVSLTSPRLSASKTSISIDVACPSGQASCQGVVRLTTLPAPGSKVAALRRGTTIGSVLFVLHPNQSKSFSVHIANQTLRLLRQAGTARVQGVAVVFGQIGSATSSGGIATIAAVTAKPKVKPKSKSK
jgi:hypothetical protein